MTLVLYGIICFAIEQLLPPFQDTLQIPQWVFEMVNFSKWPLIVFGIGMVWGGAVERTALSKKYEPKT